LHEPHDYRAGRYVGNQLTSLYHAIAQHGMSNFLVVKVDPQFLYVF